MYGVVDGKPIRLRFSFTYNKIRRGDILRINTKLKGGNQEYQSLRISTWNVNSVKNTEAELYGLIEQEKPDIVMLQETRVSNFNLTKNLGRVCSLRATPKNNVKGGYLSGGLATIATNRLMMKKDQHNTSEFILVTDLLLNNKDDPTNCHQGDYVKLINTYFQPDKKEDVKERLLGTIHRIK